MNLKKISAGFIVLASMSLASLSAHAELWGNTAAEFLYGWGYERAPEDQAILTIKHAGGWSTGDTFFFIDYSNIDDDTGTFAHAEWQGRLSMLRTFGSGAREGFLKDVYLNAQIDLDNNPFTNRRTDMVGIGLDFNVPGFRFVKLNIHHRDDPALSGSSTQASFVWNKGFKLGEQDFSFEGFLDYTTDEGTAVSNILTQPVVMWHPSERVGVGVEWQYWQDRLGFEGVNESAPQFIFRWKF